MDPKTGQWEMNKLALPLNQNWPTGKQLLAQLPQLFSGQGMVQFNQVVDPETAYKWEDEKPMVEVHARKKKLKEMLDYLL